jgi:NAD(P)-dependent dehydrogenase (short-subunit alcohol dehydrogenase family)
MPVPGFDFKGKIVAITGGRRGMGKAFTLAFAEGGADVAICDVVADGDLEAVSKAAQKLGARSLFARVDVSRKAEVDGFADRVERELGPIDILVNNAGMIVRKPLMDITEAEYDTVMDANLKGYFLCAQAVGKRMIQRKRGTIVQVASRGGFQPAPDSGAYDIAKAGVIMLTRILARELGPHGIRVNAIAPGGTKTQFNADIRTPERERALGDRLPLRRMAEIDDMVGPVLFLASGASGYVTGTTMLVDGGQMA